MTINGETKLIGFVGSTYRTSSMYAMYNAAFDTLQLNYRYVPFAVTNSKQAANAMRALGIHAIGISIPFKQDIMPHLDQLDDQAKLVGAVNVVVNRNGSLQGANTDGTGAVRALEEVTDLSGKTVLLLGAGGAARAIAFALHKHGARVTILNRTKETAAELARAISDSVSFGSLDQIDQYASDSDIIINTTPVGMLGSNTKTESLLASHHLEHQPVVMDIIGKPAQTPLLTNALQMKCPVVYGARMLLWQGVEKFRIYTGVEPPIKVMEDALQQTL